MLAAKKTLVLVTMAILVVACGGGEDLPPVGTVEHPALETDYSGAFAGLWVGTVDTTIGNQTQSLAGSQQIDASAYNRLALVGFCGTVDATVGVDSPTTATLDPIRCPDQHAECGDVAVAFYDGAGELTPGVGGLTPDTLVFTVHGKIAGCGERYDFTQVFTATRMAAAAGPLAAAPLVTAVAPGLDALLAAAPAGRP